MDHTDFEPWPEMAAHRIKQLFEDLAAESNVSNTVPSGNTVASAGSANPETAGNFTPHNISLTFKDHRNTSGRPLPVMSPPQKTGRPDLFFAGGRC